MLWIQNNIEIDEKQKDNEKDGIGLYTGTAQNIYKVFVLPLLQAKNTDMRMRSRLVKS